jgi:hypothetical protein
MDRRTFLKTLGVGLAAAPSLARAAVTEPELTVHEWGTFTTVAGEHGGALEWRPLAGKNDLPSFVYPNAIPAGDFGGKGSIRGNVRMETPVIYFYVDRPTTIDVSVDFAGGRMTEWYPQAELAGSGLSWKNVVLIPGDKRALPGVKDGNHYYEARAVDAVPLMNATGELEKFLFYRGVGTIDVPVRAKLEGTRVRVEGAGARALLFENDGKRQGVRLLEGDGLYERPVCSSAQQLGAAPLQAMLIEQGLYEKEARAMIESWRTSWFEPGLRIFWLVPRPITDQVLPLKLSQKPKELVRVLVGRTELITPELERTVLELHQKMSVLQASREPFEELGERARFAHVVLERAGLR